jgi:predicted metal-dependent phosphoesterase TrpH
MWVRVKMFKIDLHVHTALGGDSLLQPDDVVEYARAAGLDAVCVTEHHSYFASEPLEGLSRNGRFPILRALEYHASEGHLLVYGVKAGTSDLPRGLPMQRAIEWVNQRGGAAVAAHPYQKGLSGGILGDRVLAMRGLAALEVLNGSLSEWENARATEAARILRLPGIGGSDAHGPLVLGRACTLFRSPIRDMGELVAALRARDFIPSWNHGRGV